MAEVGETYGECTYSRADLADQLCSCEQSSFSNLHLYSHDAVVGGLLFRLAYAYLAEAQNSICRSGIYAILAGLDGYPPAESFCASRFPVPVQKVYVGFLRDTTALQVLRSGRSTEYMDTVPPPFPLGRLYQR
jgi:hypothetical protein